MKQCPKCGQVYDDKDLNFCYNDGELLTYSSDGPATQVQFDPPVYSNDPPPTEFMRPTRVTRESTWNPPQAPPVQWQGSQQANWPQQQAFGGVQMPMMQQVNTLAVVSLGLGIASIAIGWCCWLAFLLAPAALITGFIGLMQIKNDPQKFGGKGFAIAGLVTAGVSLVIYLLVIMLAVLGGSLG